MALPSYLSMLPSACNGCSACGACGACLACGPTVLVNTAALVAVDLALLIALAF